MQVIYWNCQSSIKLRLTILLPSDLSTIGGKRLPYTLLYPIPYTKLIISSCKQINIFNFLLPSLKNLGMFFLLSFIFYFSYLL